ncbi:MAG: SRPBCC family protein [Acidimicrobiia bacterium]
MAIQCVGDVQIDAPPEVAFTGTADIETWTSWARDLERVTILDRDRDGRASRANLVADLFGKEFDATVDFFCDPGTNEITFRLVEARKLSSLTGSFRFEAARGGSRMGFRVLMTLAKPKAARIERMVSRKLETALTRDLRRHIERTLARGR